MAEANETTRKKRTITEIRGSKATGEKMVYMSVPDYTSAQWAEMGGVDVAVVGDSLAMIAHGHPNTIPATMDMMILHAQAVRRGLAQLARTLGNLRRHGNIARYLLARMIYVDGLNTLFIFGGVYAAGRFGMNTEEILIFAILLNITAGIGAAVFGWIDDAIGAKRTILISVACLALFGGLTLLAPSKLWFYVLGCVLGIFVGPAQSASRSLMARLAPEEMRTEMFGLYALSGKATAFIGPALVGWITVATNSQELGMATILVFFLIGLVLMLPVREP